jgi:hypothetical protein
VHSHVGTHERAGPNPARANFARANLKPDDYEIVVNGLDYNTGSEVINIAMTHRRDSVQLHIDLRDDPDDIGYAVIMTREAARALGEVLIEAVAA